MPNIIQDRQINKGYFFSSDEKVEYKKLILPHLIVPNGHLIENGLKNNNHYYRLLDIETENTVALMKLVPENVHTHNYLTIKKVSSQIRRKGYGALLYKAAILNSNVPVLSDKSQTLPGSVNVWKSLQRNWRSEKKEILVLNSKNGQVLPFSLKMPMHEIWGYDEEIIAMVQEDEDILETMIEYKDISSELYNFLRENLDMVSDKKHMRLVGRRI